MSIAVTATISAGSATAGVAVAGVAAAADVAAAGAADGAADGGGFGVRFLAARAWAAWEEGAQGGVHPTDLTPTPTPALTSLRVAGTQVPGARALCGVCWWLVL